MKQRQISTKDLSRREWLELRRSGIGGSDVPVLMGKSPYRSICQLWEEKTGKAPVEEKGNEFTYWGTVMEPILRKEFTKRTGLYVRQKHALIFHKKIPYLFADLDGIATDETGERCIFEAKTASQYKAEQWEHGKVPQEYVLQVQHYLEVMGMRKAYVAALIGGNQFVWRTIYRDEQLVSEILGQEKRFWDYVTAGMEPPADGSPATGRYFDEKYGHSEPGNIQLDASLSTVFEAYDRIQEELAVLKTEKERLTNQFKQALGACEQGSIGERVVSWKPVLRRTLDGKRLKEEQPDVFQQYETETSYRRLTVA